MEKRPSKDSKKESIDKEVLTLAEQYVPLMFDDINPRILYCLLYAEQMNVDIRSHETIGKLIGAENLQVLVDRILYLRDYALLYREDKSYKLTEFGKTAAKFVELLTRPVEIEAYEKKYDGLPTKFNELGKHLVSIKLEKVRENIDWYAKQGRAA
jgi:hypothetical protein